MENEYFVAYANAILSWLQSAPKHQHKYLLRVKSRMYVERTLHGIWHSAFGIRYLDCVAFTIVQRRGCRLVEYLTYDLRRYKQNICRAFIRQVCSFSSLRRFNYTWDICRHKFSPFQINVHQVQRKHCFFLLPVFSIQQFLFHKIFNIEIIALNHYNILLQ